MMKFLFQYLIITNQLIIFINQMKMKWMNQMKMKQLILQQKMKKKI
jgi:hypothetical protein